MFKPRLGSGQPISFRIHIRDRGQYILNQICRAVLFKTWQGWLRDNLPNTWLVWVYNWPAVRMGEINAMSNIKNNEKSAKIQMYKPYLAEFLSFNFFVTIHWGLNRFSHEHVKGHRDFILPSTTIGYLWFTHSTTSPVIRRLISAMRRAE